MKTLKASVLTAFVYLLLSGASQADDKMMHDHMMMPGMGDKKMGDESMAPKDQVMPTGVFSKSDKGFQVMLHFNPTFLKTKSETKVMIMVTDEKTHQTALIESATVKWVMGKMWHEVAKQPLKADDNGYFHTNINFPMTGDYSAIVTFKKQGKPISISVPFAVMAEPKNETPKAAQ